jgi:uncharacterized protein
MTAFLLDVNVLIALGWRAHPDHVRVLSWFAKQSVKGWATCPFTQAAFVRIVSNPAFSVYAASPREALQLLSFNLKHPKHQFWADDLTLDEALSRFTDKITGHQQVTDAYLLGLAIRKKGRFATLDRSVLALLPAGAPGHDAVELIAAGP